MNKSVIVFGPSGCGKTTHAVRLAKFFGLNIIADHANLAQPPSHRNCNIDTLYLVRDRPAWVDSDARRVIQFSDAMRLAKDAEARECTP